MPVEPCVLDERHRAAGIEAEPGPELAVERIAAREEHRERIRPGDAASIAASTARGESSAEPPKTASASPLEPSRKDRRDRPVPAGIGIPGSIAGSPRPASATALRSSSVRLQS